MSYYQLFAYLKTKNIYSTDAVLENTDKESNVSEAMYIFSKFQESELAKCLHKARDITEEIRQMCITNHWWRHLIALPVFNFAKMYPAALTPEDVRRFLNACHALEAARVRGDRADNDANLKTVAALLSSCLKFDPSYFPTSGVVDDLLNVFGMRDAVTAVYARLHVATHVCLLVGVVGQYVCQGCRAPSEAIRFRYLAASMQCLSAVMQVGRGETPGGYVGMMFLGLLQLLSDIAVWLDPQMQPDMQQLHTRGLHRYTRALMQLGKLDENLWDKQSVLAAGTDEIISYQEMAAMWGHYLVFTCMFLPRRVNRSWTRLLWVIWYGGVMAATGLFQYNKDARLLPPNVLDARYHALDSYTMRVAVDATNADLGLYQMEANYLLVLAAAFSNSVLAAPPTAADFFGMQAKLPKGDTHTYREAWTQIQDGVRKHTPDCMTEAYLRVREWVSSDLTDAYLQLIEQHLHIDSLVFQTYFSKLHKFVVQHKRQPQIKLFFDAAKPSLKAFMHYAQNQRHRGPTEQIYADVYYSPESGIVTNKQFQDTLQAFDNKLTQVLLTGVWGSTTSEEVKGRYARNHLVLIDLTKNIKQVGFLNHTDPSQRSSTFMASNTPLRIPIDPKSFYHLDVEAARYRFPRQLVQAIATTLPPPPLNTTNTSNTHNSNNTSNARVPEDVSSDDDDADADPDVPEEYQLDNEVARIAREKKQCMRVAGRLERWNRDAALAGGAIFGGVSVAGAFIVAPLPALAFAAATATSSMLLDYSASAEDKAVFEASYQNCKPYLPAPSNENERREAEARARSWTHMYEKSKGSVRDGVFHAANEVRDAVNDIKFS